MARALSELYGALILLAAAITLTTLLYPLLNVKLYFDYKPRPILLLNINSTHAICYTTAPLNITYWKSVGEFKCWVIGGVNQYPIPCPEIVQPDTYIIVSPPWLCR